MKESGIYIMLSDLINLQGKTISEVAREKGISRNTIKKYLREGEQPHKSKGMTKSSKLDPYKDIITSCLSSGTYNACSIMDRICEEGYTGGISILKEYVSPLRPPLAKVGTAVRRYETKPGRQAQMDWGIMRYIDGSGRIYKVACFVMAMGFCRARYVEYSRRCDESSLLRCMLNAFEYFGGVPETVLTDRMKTVIVSTDHGKPVWQRTFERFATEMGFVPKVCRVRRPQTKGKVERLVHFVRDNFMAGRRFTDFGDLQRQALAWCDRMNARIHGSTGEIPFDDLKLEELKPLPNEMICRFYRWETRKVARDGFLSFNGTWYGVKWQYSGETLYVSQSGEQIRIADDNGELIQIHDVCYRARKHIWAKGQYDNFVEQAGIPHTPPYGIQVPVDTVEVRSLEVYERLSEVNQRAGT